MREKIKVLVLMGGNSTERDVSLKSGTAISESLKRNKYDVYLLDVNKNNILEINSINPDVVFLALHGKGGEDGKIQGLLEWLNIPYTGSGVASSAICMNKILTKKLLIQSGIVTPKFIEIGKNDLSNNLFIENLIHDLGMPMVLKASSEGSSIGVSIVENKSDLVKSAKKLFQYGDLVFAEQYIKGTEITVPILGNEDPKILPIIEIVSETGVYDYDAKYTVGASRHIIPARISKNCEDKVKKFALKIFSDLKCRGVARIDFIVQNDIPYFIEVNTLPGMTQLSLLPDSANQAGISFDKLTSMLVELALNNIRD